MSFASGAKAAKAGDEGHDGHEVYEGQRPHEETQPRLDVDPQLSAARVAVEGMVAPIIPRGE